jgi:hypothetical protein
MDLNKKRLIVGAHEIAVTYDASKGFVIFAFDLPEDELGLLQGLTVGVGVAPADALALAALIAQTAQQVGTPRPPTKGH